MLKRCDCDMYRLTIALKLMSEVIAAATISVFTVHFRGRGKRPMVLLEILGLAVKKGDLMGKGLGRLMIAYLRHLAHRIQYGTFLFIIKIGITSCTV